MPAYRPIAASAACVAVWALFVILRMADQDRPLPAGATSPLLSRVHIVWPAEGQAAMELEGVGTFGATTNARPVPIASLAKIMTAYLVLRDAPVDGHADGFQLTVSRSDVRDAARRRSDQQSVISVRAGERMTERQLLEALLVPSANNVAALLAVHDAGSVAAFVEKMNSTARRLGLRSTTYTDPSGFDPRTLSTATDQLHLIETAIRNPLLASIVALRSVRLPVAGVVHNTNPLLGTGGFVGAKTGSDDAAGGCLAFVARREVFGRSDEVIGVVLGQRAPDVIAAAATAASRMVNSAFAGLSRIETGPGS
jgi:serine-type D-Ala-D-Ala carboxypeptidase (penicillin-binding protein 5/6)